MTTDSVVSSYLAEFRVRYDVTQAVLAAAARATGVPWTRSTVAAIESGHRRLYLDEYAVLDGVLSRAAGVLISTDDLLARLRVDRPVTSIHQPDEAAWKAASTLGVDVAMLHQAAVAMYGHGLDEEREARVGADRRRGHRGHVTRAILRELRGAMGELL